MRKKFEFNTVVTMIIPAVVVASDLDMAKARFEAAMKKTIENDIKHLYVKNHVSIVNINSEEELPDHFTNEHHTLIEMGYPIDVIKNYSQEDAEEEIHAAMQSI